MCKKNISLDTTGLEKWSTGNCARNLNLIIRTNDICPRKWDAQNSLGFWNTNGSSNLDQTTRPRDSQQQQQQQQQKRTCRFGSCN